MKDTERGKNLVKSRMEGSLCCASHFYFLLHDLSLQQFLMNGDVSMGT